MSDKHLIAVGRVANGAATIRFYPPRPCPKCGVSVCNLVHRPAVGSQCQDCEKKSKEETP